jgi:hypothetical protein
VRILLPVALLATGLLWLVGCGIAGLGYNSGWYLGAIPFGFAFLFALAWAEADVGRER